MLAARALADGEVELARARVLRVRRQARLLVFATIQLLVPPRRKMPSGDSCADSAEGDSRELPPIDAAWQLIVGKSFINALGEDAARELMKDLRPGCIVSASGRCQPNPRGGLDLVTYELDILDAKELEQEPMRPVEAMEATAQASQASEPLSTQLGELQVEDPTAVQTAGPRAAAPTSPVVFSNVPSTASPHEPPAVYLVDDGDGLAELDQAMGAAMGNREPVAFDCEWRPSRLSQADSAWGEQEGSEDAPLAVLQLATCNAAFVVDVLAFDARSSPQSHSMLQRIVSTLMRSEATPKLGFACSDDLRRIEAHFPGSTDGVTALYDLQRPATRAVGLPRRTLVGLSTACEVLLGGALDKAQQVRASFNHTRSTHPNSLEPVSPHPCLDGMNVVCVSSHARSLLCCTRPRTGRSGR